MEKCEVKPYLVDVPVRVNIWIRPQCQREQFEVLKKARPSVIFLQSDGGRNEKEWAAIYQNRKIFDEEIDWDCKVYKFYENENLGLYTMGSKVAKAIWEKVDRCIFLEDDHIPSVSFFQYCAELLEKYKDDLRIDCICGMNHLGKSENVTADYFFSRQGSIWGNATWKRAVEMRDTDFSYAKDPYIMKLLYQRTRRNKIFRKRIDAYAKQKYYEGHVAGGEFFKEFAMYGQNQLQIIPKVNMIKNTGATEDAAHVDSLKKLPRGLRRIFNMQTYELEFPIKHTRYVIPDIEYEKKRNRIMAYNAPLIAFWRKIESVFLLGFFTKLKRRRERKNKLEK
ncbi:MAG: hemolysin activation protein [Clostridiales bacterium]|nr:hemolysin activation protein [Clostridiales bacterium]